MRETHSIRATPHQRWVLSHLAEGALLHQNWAKNDLRRLADGVSLGNTSSAVVQKFLRNGWIEEVRLPESTARRGEHYFQITERGLRQITPEMQTV